MVLAGASSALDGLFAFVKTSQSIRTSQSYQYNGNLPYQVTDARGNTTAYTYDYSRGLQTAVTDARGNATSYTYQNENDRLLAVTAGGSTVSYGYHADGTPESITSPSGTVYGFAYDTYKRQTGVTVGGAQLSATQYKNNYQTLVDTLTYGNGSSVGYRYDSLDRLTEKRYNGSVAARYTYDRLGRLTRTEDLVRGTVTEMEYDLTGRLLSIRNAESAAGVEEGVYTRGRGDLARLEYAYDDLARVSRIRQTAAGSTVTYGLEYATANTGTKKLGRISGISVNGIQILDYAYDVLGRSAARTLGTTVPFVTEYSYLPGGDAAKTTTLVETLKNNENTYTYAYDELGNITSVSVNGTVAEAYTYDALGQLTGAVVGENTYAYTYDAGGNLTARTKNGETVAVYGYSDEHWADLLTTYNGVSITYDGIGNPFNWKDGETFTWSNGRQLTGITTEGGSITYTYDESGQRTGKDVNGEKTAYYWLNGQLQGQKSENEAISFLYDETGNAFGMIYNGAYYYYERNLQGDIIGIIDSTGTRVVEYAYGVWGELLSVTGTMADTIGQKNPLRYRGYYYDCEIGFYYAGSRYYDPEVGRWISADSVLAGIGGSVQGYNLFAYCFNNPVNMSDHSGRWPKWLENAANWVNKNIVQPVANFFSPKTNTASGQFQDGIFRGSGSLTGGYSEFNGRLQVNSKDNKNNGMLGGYGKASAGNASGKIGIGNNNAALSLKGVGDGLTATAQAGIQYKNGAGVAAKAKAAVLSGRATAELELFGWQIEFGVSGDLLSVGAEAMIGVFPDEGFTAKASIGAGLFGSGFVFRVKPNQ